MNKCKCDNLENGDVINCDENGSCKGCGRNMLAKYSSKENWYIKAIQDFYQENIEISKRKSNDYASDTDPFSNFRKVENMGLTVAQGILVRMGDKMSRLEELLGKGKEGKVEDEKITDTLSDLCNYGAIMSVYLSTLKDPDVPN